ncbi:MAG: hypothetical protein WCD37_16590 [Chloroflexia bacterium]
MQIGDRKPDILEAESLVFGIELLDHDERLLARQFTYLHALKYACGVFHRHIGRGAAGIKLVF